MPPTIELFGSTGCPWTAEARAWLDDRGVDFVEYDVEADALARARLSDLTAGRGLVPVIVEGGRVTVGWRGRGCLVTTARPARGAAGA